MRGLRAEMAMLQKCHIGICTKCHGTRTVVHYPLEVPWLDFFDAGHHYATIARIASCLNTANRRDACRQSPCIARSSRQRTSRCNSWPGRSNRVGQSRCRHPRCCRIGRPRAMFVRAMMVGKGRRRRLTGVCCASVAPLYFCIPWPTGNIGSIRANCALGDRNGAARRQARR